MGKHSETVSFHYSTAKICLKLSVALAVTVVGAAGCLLSIQYRDAVSIGGATSPARLALSLFAVTAGLSCAAIFGAVCSAILIWRYGSHRGAVVTFSPSGFTDMRIAAEEIPWKAIAAIVPGSSHRQHYLTLVLSPGCQGELSARLVQRWSAGLVSGLGIEGPTISASDLNTDFETLAHLFDTYLNPTKRVDVEQQQSWGNQHGATGFGRRSTFRT